ncbi:MAG: glycosyltransferase [Ignavibacteriales bacterium]|nr:glycosyltransferase [Ignavibacteriales bacterium]
MSKTIQSSNRIAVREIDIENIEKEIGSLADYQKAFFVFRYKDAVIGRETFQIRNGRIDLEEVRDYVARQAMPVWKKFVEKFNPAKRINPFVSVVVCSHDRTDELEFCLESLMNLEYYNKEIIIVDSAPSNDSTFQLVQRFSDVYYFKETQIGLDIARNVGLRIAKGEIVAFTDDDARVDPNWLDNLVQNFANPIVGVVTGITMPVELETDAQIYFEYTNGFNRGFYRCEYDFNKINPIAAGKVGAGVNMAIRKSILDEVGYFDEALDGGMPTCSGGDQEYFYRVLIHGFRIIYEPTALVWHRHRRDFLSLKKTIYGYGVGVFAWWTRALIYEKEFKLLILAPTWFLRHHVLNMIKSLVKNKIARELAIAEFKGAITGSLKYFKTKRKLDRKKIIPSEKLLPSKLAKEVLELE